jgi:hypothetical protein
LLAASKYLKETQEITFSTEIQNDYEDTWVEIKRKSSSPGFEQALEAGQAMSLKEAVAFALDVQIN